MTAPTKSVSRACTRSAIPGALAALTLWAALALAPFVDTAGAASKTLVGKFQSPIYVTAPDGDPRLFVVERGGRIVIDGQTSPFLDITDRVVVQGEGGLLSMAFAPDYAQSGLFYVFFTNRSGAIRIYEFRRNPDNPNDALESSARRVMRITHPTYQNHYGGQLQFGPGGALFVSTGDGGGGDDPNGNAQDKGSLLGKILRINPRPDGGDPYGVPRSNPFVGRSGRDEIFAYGLRNPYRFSFDRLTGDLTIGDVGQDRREEIDFRRAGARPGANFGWDCFEGTLVNEGGRSCLRGPSGHRKPVHEYRRIGSYCSVIGGYVARDASLGSLQGDYVYGDFCNDTLRAVRLTGDGSSDDRAINVDVQQLVSFGEDGSGRLYAVSLEGQVYRLSG